MNFATRGISADLKLLKDVIRIITHMGACSVDKRIVGVTTKSGFKKSTWKDAPLLLDHRDISVYKRDFEDIFLAATSQFYEIQCQHWIAEGNVAQYLQHVTAAFAYERTHRVSKPRNFHKACGRVREAILRGPKRSHLTFILASATGVGYMLNNDKFADLQTCTFSI